MRLIASYIHLRQVRFHAFHGVMPQERLVGADFVLDLKVGYPLGRAMQSDEVADTLNYAALYDLVTCEMQQPSKLLEHVAARIAQTISQAFPQITSIDLVFVSSPASVPAGRKRGAAADPHGSRQMTKH